MRERKDMDLKLHSYYSSSWRKCKGMVHFVPGFNGSPAYMRLEDAIEHFWSDKSYIERGAGVGLDLPASRIEFPVYRVGDRRKRTSSTADNVYIVIKTSDEGLEHCQWCGGPALGHSRCALCGNYPTTGKDELEDN